ncbi:ABC-type transport system (lipoprotein release), permease component [Nitritalea halalkaliphila LW7]|uniref:ABC-type transport system (Lipoprotein release), permease component n=1 Tax=Nitritalea halalkaliphila LW7 TaxID=1189621 RepID=I5BVU7_9BACT|nr:ABC transporter permease [Nitritalea halalkaliphila]EIM73699.1 ABC-type transport system (lipoprotein release), permease component [Nitritalea halalkaliphila LW7]
MAWRNLWRNKVRSLAVMVAVVIGLVAGMFASALVEGIMSSRFTNFIENQVSHMQLHHPDFIREREVQQFIVGPTLPLQDVQGREGIAAATTRTKLQGMVASASYTGMVELVGILPESENRTTNFARHMVAGEYLSDQVSNSILIGAALAAKLKVGIGSRIVLSYQDLENQLVSGRLSSAVSSTLATLAMMR